MKKGLFKHGIAIIGIAVLAFLSLASASRGKPAVTSVPSTTSTSNEFATNDSRHWGVFGEVAIFPMKDFETRGLVFTEHVYQPGATNADAFTYQALLKEAQKLGADAIINVTIDRQIQTVTKIETLSTTDTNSSTDTGDSEKISTTSTHTQELWYGSALAIKYTSIVVLQNNQSIILGGDPRVKPQP